MKKISENRLRQIVNEELSLELQKHDDNKVAKQNLDKIFSILQYAEETHQPETQNLNEFVGMLGRGALGAAGIAGLLGMDADDVMKGAEDVLSGDQEFNITDGMVDWVQRQLIAKGLAAVNIDDELNNVLTAALMAVDIDELKDFFFHPTCEKFIDWVWVAFVEYLAAKLAEPLSAFAGSVGQSTPYIIQAFTDGGGFGAEAMVGGVSMQTLKLYLLNNPDAAYWMDENIKSKLCVLFDDIDFDMKSMTGGILNGLISFAS